MRSIYFLSYGAIMTVSLVVMVWGYYARFKREGTPINYPMLLLITMVTLAMWAGAALTEFAYDINPTTAGFSAFFVGVIFSVLFAWQVNTVIKNIEEDRKVIKELSTRDALTGLWNRRIFHEYFDHEIARVVSYKYKKHLSLLMIDIDKLPEFNEKHGFMRGDMVLREFGARMMANVRDIDRACRFVDGVAAVVLPKMDRDDVIEFAEKLGSLVIPPYDLGDGKSATVTFSIAVAPFPDGGKDDNEMITGILRTLSAARDSGGDCIYLSKGKGECERIDKSGSCK